MCFRFFDLSLSFYTTAPENETNTATFPAHIFLIANLLQTADVMALLIQQDRLSIAGRPSTNVYAHLTLTLTPMTFILDLDLDVLKTYLLTILSGQGIQKLYPDRETQTRLNALPLHIRGGEIVHIVGATVIKYLRYNPCPL